MTFAWPQLLFLLLVPAALAARETARRRGAAAAHPKILRAEAGQRTLRLTGTAEAAGRRRARWWLAAGLALAVVALARPQWGQVDEPVFDQSREILLALDLSRSMLTPDVRPSRLERSKLLIQALLDRLSGERVGLVIFSGTAFLQSPLSADYEILREFLPSLKPDFMPEGGTNYGALIDTAAAAFGTGAADRFLIVLSDGGATDEDWRSHLAKLKAKGIRVIGLGVGTSAGAVIPDGTGGLVKDDRGAAVLSRLENETLRELADKTGGAYRDASQWVDLASVLRATVEAGRKGKFTEKNNVRHVERYQWALAPALLCLLLSFWREFPVRPRPRDIQLGPEDAGVEEGKGTPPGLRTGAAAATLLLLAAGAGLARLSAEPTADPASAAPLAHIVSRLAAEDTRSAQDWAELAGETLSWGGRVPVRPAAGAGGTGARRPRLRGRRIRPRRPRRRLAQAAGRARRAAAEAAAPVPEGSAAATKAAAESEPATTAEPAAAKSAELRPEPVPAAAAAEPAAKPIGPESPAEPAAAVRPSAA